MLARECAPENAGVAGYAEAFRCVLSGKQASMQSSYLRTAILACNRAGGCAIILKISPFGVLIGGI